MSACALSCPVLPSILVAHLVFTCHFYPCCYSDLIQSIPNLGQLLGDDGCDSSNGDNRNGRAMDGEGSAGPISKQQLLHRSKFLLCKLIGAIAVKQNPLVLVFDDIHWADDTSLSTIQTIVTDPDIQYCLYVGCYRGNEIGAQNIMPIIDDIKKQGVHLFTIHLGPFEKETVNRLVSESMCLPPSLSMPLSTIVHAKTGGSPLFCVNFLRDGMVRFNLHTRRWEYDIKSILMKETPPSVVQYMKGQMAKLPQSYCLVLKLAACLGDHFDQDTFLKAKIKSDCDLEKILPCVIKIGFLHEVSSGKYMWGHDQFRQAAYELIPENVRAQFHLLIGTRLLMNRCTNEVQNGAILFDILSHINKGITLIQTKEQKYEVRLTI